MDVSVSENVTNECIDCANRKVIGTYALCLAMGNAADAVEIISIGFVLAEIREASQFSKEFLGAAVFLGMLVGGILCGVLSDRIGRRPCLLVSLGINATAGLMSAFSPNISILIAIRIAAGIGIGGSIPTVFSLGAEIFPAATRGKLLSIVASFWMVGAIFVATIAWIMLGNTLSGNRIMPHSNWRWFSAACSLPAFTAWALTYVFIPESPRFLIKNGEFHKAAVILSSMGTMTVDASSLRPQQQQRARKLSPSPCRNTSNDSPEMFNSATHHIHSSSVTSSVLHDQSMQHTNRRPLIDIDDRQLDDNDHTNNPFTDVELDNTVHQRNTSNGPQEQMNERNLSVNSSGESSNDDTKHIGSYYTAPASMKLLFSKSLKSVTIKLMIIWFTLSFGSYGITTWISVLFKDIGVTNAFADSFIFALANFPGNLVSILFIDRYGRRRLLCFGMCLSAVCAFGFAADSQSKGAVVSCAALFNAFSVIGWNSLDCLTVEMFPTAARSTAMGILAGCGRIGAISAQFVNGNLEGNIPLLLSVTCGCMVAGGLVALFLPDDHSGTRLINDFDKDDDDDDDNMVDQQGCTSSRDGDDRLLVDNTANCGGGGAANIVTTRHHDEEGRRSYIASSSSSGGSSAAVSDSDESGKDHSDNVALLHRRNRIIGSPDHCNSLIPRPPGTSAFKLNSESDYVALNSTAI